MWHIPLTIGFVTARVAKMFLMTAVYIGRIDTPFLDTSVNLFGLGIDQDYKNFYADVLLHETHRHPYIERLSLMYLLKLQHGKNFATREGSCWRLLVTLAVMPWLHRYRSRVLQVTTADRMLDAEQKDDNHAAGDEGADVGVTSTY